MGSKASTLRSTYRGDFGVSTRIPDNYLTSPRQRTLSRAQVTATSRQDRGPLASAQRSCRPGVLRNRIESAMKCIRPRAERRLSCAPTRSRQGAGSCT